MEKHLLLLLIFVSSGLAHASNPIFLPEKVEIKAIRVYSGDSPGHYIKVKDLGYYEGCPLTKDTGEYFLPPGSKEAYSMLLAAKTSNQEVLLAVKGYDECSQGIGVGHAQVVEVQLGDW